MLLISVVYLGTLESAQKGWGTLWSMGEAFGAAGGGSRAPGRPDGEWK